jgi:hypothetical protein
VLELGVVTTKKAFVMATKRILFQIKRARASIILAGFLFPAPTLENIDSIRAHEASIDMFSSDFL